MHNYQELRQSLTKPRTILGLGLGMYWLLIVFASMSAHPYTPLGEVEMMKRFGGQGEGPALCALWVGSTAYCQDFHCNTGCTEADYNSPCEYDNGTEAWYYTGYYPEVCNTISGGQYCTVTGINTDVWCNKKYKCYCQPVNNLPQCVGAPTVTITTCIAIDVGDSVPCPYTACPP